MPDDARELLPADRGASAVRRDIDEETHVVAENSPVTPPAAVG
jgi:hypothetical protein